MPLNLQEKYDAIHAQEEQFAYRLAKDVVKKPEASAWMILVPILFVHHVMKIGDYKEGVRSFAKNILSSKEKALNMAHLELQSGTAQSGSSQDYFSDVKLDTSEEKVLAEKQVKVIQFLQKHYLNMLNQSGNTFEELIRGAYKTAGEYRRFLNDLTKLERDANQYLADNFQKDEEYIIILRKIEEQTEALREEELSFFFNNEK